jgi:hypothetical protein
MGALELARVVTELSATPLEPTADLKPAADLEPTADLPEEPTANERPQRVRFELGPVVNQSPSPSELASPRPLPPTMGLQRPRRFDKLLPETMELEALDKTIPVDSGSASRALVLLAAVSTVLILALGLALGVILQSVASG